MLMEMDGCTYRSSVSIATGPSNTTINDVISKVDHEIEFLELVLAALGIEITFDDFCKMSSDERKSLIRDIRINRILPDEHK